MAIRLNIGEDSSVIAGLMTEDSSFRDIIDRICRMNKEARQKRLREVLKSSGRENIYTELLTEGVAEKYQEWYLRKYRN